MSAYQTLYNMIQTLPDPDGTLKSNVKSVIDNHKTNNISVVLAFPLKVGGTFLRNALIHLLGKNYSAGLVRGAYASTDQSRELYFPSVLHHHVTQSEKPMASVSHSHMFATKPVTCILEAFKIPVIVNTRNIFDSLLSYYEMLEKDAGLGFVAGNDFVLQSHSNYHDMSPDERRWHLVNVAPIWYSRFYAYWIRYTDNCTERGIRQPLWTTFDELKDNPVPLLAKFAEYVDPNNEYSEKEVTAAYQKSVGNKKQLLFNKGKTGRGPKFFDADEQKAILRLMGQRPEYARRLEEYGII
jgi:hypothetical protein